MHTGIYEQLITQLLQERCDAQGDRYFVQTQKMDSAEAAEYLSRFLREVLRGALERIPQAGEGSRIQRQV